MKKILATAYAVNPYKGSEDAMGWNYILQIAAFNKVIAITRENNKSFIDKYMLENPNELYENIQFLYYDLPYWMRFWKKGSRGALLYFLMWQMGVVSFIRKNVQSYDIVHNLNFHNDWTPSFLWKLKKPFVWGPVGHHQFIPGQYLKMYSKKYWFKDRLTWLVKRLFWDYFPCLSNTVKKADFIWCMNNTVPGVLGLKNQIHFIRPSVAAQDFGFEPQKTKEKFRLISVGRLVPLKGFDLTLFAFAKFVKSIQQSEKFDCELVIVGSGPEESLYKKIVQDEGIADYVKFISWVEHKEMPSFYKESSAFLFPSHEGAGMVVAEALSFGLPVICLNNSGPGEFIDDKCGYAIELQSYSQTVKSLADAIYDLYSNPTKLQEMSIQARALFLKKFDWKKKGELLSKIYNETSMIIN